MNENKDDDLFTGEEASDIDKVQGIRRRILDELVSSGINTPDGKIIPIDKDDRALLLSVMDGMDRTSFTKIKIKAEKKASDNVSKSATLVAEALKAVNSKTFAQATSAEREVPPSHLDRTFVEGETDIGNKPLYG